jgi:hypothetical protein
MADHIANPRIRILYVSRYCRFPIGFSGGSKAPDGINNRNSRGNDSHVTGLSTDHPRCTLDDARRGVDTRQSSIAFSYLGGVEIE